MPRHAFGRTLSFVKTNVTLADGHHRPVARFTCGCGATIDVPQQTGLAINPQSVATQACRMGWQADAYNRSATRCPDCQAARKTQVNDVDSELRRLEVKMAKEGSGPMKIKEVPLPMEEGETVVPVPIRAPTADQRGMIRGLLEKHFDDDEGMFLSDWSDQKVAETVNVPRIVVEQIRETAYGSIRITAAQVALRTEIAALRKEFTDMKQVTDDLFAQLSAKLDELEQKAGAKAA